MIHRIICEKCKVVYKYDDKFVWEGNREQDEITW